MNGDYQIIQLANGENTLFSKSYGEKMHPGLGPAAEAELLYVQQLRLRERLAANPGGLVIWDIGLGGAANATAALRATRDIPGELRLVSFDNTLEPLAFALQNPAAFSYLHGFEEPLTQLLRDRHVTFQNGALRVIWTWQLGDFPTLLAAHVNGGALLGPPPHAIFFDAFSPAKNPAMWTLPVFTHLRQALSADRPCALTTYSRSTLIRATLLRAGFYVGAGHATGLKEETTIAANDPALIPELLDARWLARAARSDSAEPLAGPVYQRFPASPATLDALRRQRQFSKM